MIGEAAAGERRSRRLVRCRDSSQATAPDARVGRAAPVLMSCDMDCDVTLPNYPLSSGATGVDGGSATDVKSLILFIIVVIGRCGCTLRATTTNPGGRTFESCGAHQNPKKITSFSNRSAAGLIAKENRVLGAHLRGQRLQLRDEERRRLFVRSMKEKA
jgi:hypothetical protein